MGFISTYIVYLLRKQADGNFSGIVTNLIYFFHPSLPYYLLSSCQIYLLSFPHELASMTGA